MQLPSHLSALFLATVLTGLWLAGRAPARKLVLAAANIAFLAWVVPPGAAMLLLALSACTYGACLGVARGGRAAVAFQWAGVAVLLGGLVAGRASWGSEGFGGPLATTAPSISFSFALFPLLALLFDVGRGQVPVPALADFLVFSPFFPVLTAGPVARPTELLPQLATLGAPDPRRARVAVERVTLGLVKKFVLADRLGLFYQQLGHQAGTAPTLYLLMFYVYAAEVYFDFAGYSDIAIGVARALGLKLPENFQAPYLAESPVDWWRRWHISLAQFLRDYFYYPLFFRVKNVYVCTFATFVVNGLWHGVGWNFLFLGLYWGTAISLYLLVREWWDGSLPRWARIFLTLQIGVGSFVFFLPGGMGMFAAAVTGAFSVYHWRYALLGLWPEPFLVFSGAAGLLLLWRRLGRGGAAYYGVLYATWLFLFTFGLFSMRASYIYSQF